MLKSITLNHIVLYLVTAAIETLKTCALAMTASTGWMESIKYLGVHTVVGKKLSFDINALRRSFYSAFNNICSHTKTLEEVVQLTLHESYCLPLLTYRTSEETVPSVKN